MENIININHPNYPLDDILGYNIYPSDLQGKPTAKVNWFNFLQPSTRLTQVKDQIRVLTDLVEYLKAFRDHNEVCNLEGNIYWEFGLVIDTKFIRKDADPLHVFYFIDPNLEGYQEVIDNIEQRVGTLSDILTTL